MAAPIPKHSKKLKTLIRMASTVQASFFEQHRQVGALLKESNIDLPAMRTREQRESAVPSATDSQTVTDVTAALREGHSLQETRLLSISTTEEFAAVLEKLSSALNQPPGVIEETSLLYLEQQLSELLGMTVCGNLEGHRLPYHTGVVRSEPHRRRFPTDTLDQHERVVEAGMRATRSYYGWYMVQNALSQEGDLRERYTVSLPLHLLPNWADLELQRWYAFRKVVVINPFDLRAVVACVGDCMFDSSLKYQLGGSPELIRESLAWSPNAQGKLCVLFVDESDRQVPLGPLNIKEPVL